MISLIKRFAYFREMWLWPIFGIIFLYGSSYIVRSATGRSPADDAGEITGVIIAATPIYIAAFIAVILDGHLYWSLTREEWLEASLKTKMVDGTKPIIIFLSILIFEYFYLRH